MRTGKEVTPGMQVQLYVVKKRTPNTEKYRQTYMCICKRKEQRLRTGCV